MNISSQLPERQADLSVRDAVPFLMITFGLAWGIFMIAVTFPDAVGAIFGEISASNPLFLMAVYSPAFAAFALVLRVAGWRGLIRYLKRLLLWRSPAPWLLFVFLGIPAVYVIAAFFQGSLWESEFPYSTLGALLGAMGFMLILGPVEEFGWRGVLQPLLQRRLAPIWSGLIVGFIWGVWHLPAFLLSGTPQGGWDFGPFLLGAIAIGVILTPFFNATGGSILWAALFHFQLNNPLWPDAQPLDMYLFAAIAVVVVWLNHETMFDRKAGVTTVIPEERTTLGGTTGSASQSWMRVTRGVINSGIIGSKDGTSLGVCRPWRSRMCCLNRAPDLFRNAALISDHADRLRARCRSCQ